ncbi:MAG: diadenylate cyclase CdaA [Phycisphaerales bacterium]|nr:diadenylate cyclase CdaA [Phycisphaerales bacterium]
MFKDLFKEIRDFAIRAEMSDLIELVLIGAVVYAIMRFLRGTRGARLLRGFILLLLGSTLLLFWLASVADLAHIRVIYPYFMYALFLMALVAFQPELRRALIRLGAATWFIESSQEMDRVIDAVTEATGYLSKNKIGAIVAFERATEFGALAENGVILDAEVSKELLTTIFWPGSALHDMGVLISQGRVAAAAIQFPLTESDEIDPSLGSRHRAAVGLSQESDALVLVVSEETGIISLVENGEMQRELTPDGIRPVLRAALGRPAAEKKKED